MVTGEHDDRPDDAWTVAVGPWEPAPSFDPEATQALQHPTVLLPAADPALQATSAVDYVAPTRVIAQTPDIYHQPTDGIQPLGPGEVLRFGPGVPVPAASGPDHVAAVWHGVARPAEPDRRPHRLRRWILPFLVLVAVLALLAWFRLGKPLAVTGATVHTSAVPVSCSGTATVTGTLQTNGAAGTVTYRWKRSDGTVSNDLQQQVAKGTNTVDVVLLWSFNGPGTVQATATLDVLSPSPVTAATTFSYVCK